jgi:uncharacterized protein involved in exopolysaccharide biosynthesis
MAQITEKLENEVVEKLKSSQAQANEAVLGLGQAELRIVELKAELEGVEKFKEDTLTAYRTAVNAINEELKQLETKYPSGEVDLVAGVVIYEDGK